MRNAKAEGERWLEQATLDLEAGRKISENGLWWIVCFQAQQAAEKAVKAYLYARGERLVLGHSVAQLIREAAEHDSGFLALAEAGARLDGYYIAPRYPNAIPGGVPAHVFTEGQAREALELAGQVLSFAKKACEHA